MKWSDDPWGKPIKRRTTIRSIIGDLLFLLGCFVLGAVFGQSISTLIDWIRT